MTSRERQPNEPERRRARWWVIPLVVIALALVLAFLWVFRFRIQRAFEPAPTLPPPPPTAAEAGEPAGSEGGEAGSVLYQTTFDDPAAGEDWELFDDGIVAARIEERRLVVEVDAITDQGTWSGLNYTFEDFVLDVDAAKLGGPDNNGIIVIFRLVDNENYNRFDISSDGYYRLIAVRDGVQRVVSGDWAFSPAILTREATNHLRVEAAGDTFRFMVNDEPLRLCVSEDENTQPIPMEDECLGGEYVMQWTNGDLIQGKIGLGAQGFTGFDGEQATPAEATIGFDNLVITDVEE